MLTKENRFKVIGIFFKNPTKEFHIREIAGMTGLSPAGALKILNAHEKNKLLIKEERKATTNYRANVESDEFIQLKKIFNLYSIYSSGLLKKLIEFYNTPEAMILFGSYARAEDMENGDVDIAIVTEKRGYPDLKKFERELDRKVSLHLLADVKKSEREFVNSLANGIVLFGYLKVV